MKTKIGIIGLGTMGMGIAENLLKRGYVVQGFDLLPERMQLLEQKGGTAAPSPAQAADGASALILMVFNGEQVQDVLFGLPHRLDTRPVRKRRKGWNRWACIWSTARCAVPLQPALRVNST